MLDGKARLSAIPDELLLKPHSILILPDKSLLLHISSDGFREWNESVGKGKLTRLASGAHMKLDV